MTVWISGSVWRQGRWSTGLQGSGAELVQEMDQPFGTWVLPQCPRALPILVLPELGLTFLC